MVGRLAICLVFATACDQVFGLERPPDAAIDDVDVVSLHDEDGDSIADSIDNCPGVENPAQAQNLDTDLVGDACDPDPFSPVHALANFYAFVEPDADVVWFGLGAWQVGDDELIYAPAPPDRVAIANRALTIAPDTTIEVGFTITALPSATFGAIEVFPAAGDTPVGRTEPHCVIRWDPTAMQLIALEHVGAAGPMAPLALSIDAPYRLVIRYGANQLACTLYGDGSSPQSSVVTFTNPPPSGRFTVQSHSFALRVPHVVRYEGR